MPDSKSMYDIGIIGGGSWATALAYLVLHNGHRLWLWVRRPDQAHSIQEKGHNPDYLSWLELPTTNLHVSTDLNRVLSHSKAIVVVVPAAFVHDILVEIKENFGGSVATAIKGLVKGKLPPASFLKEQGYDSGLLTVFGGPTHAEEVAMRKQSFLTMASESASQIDFWKEVFSTSWFHIFKNNDPYGVEWAGVLKNVYAIGAGIANGLALGDNLVAILVSQAMQEMQQFLSVVAPANRNILESAYLGDLLVTAYSQHSRNRTFGVMIGRGYLPRTAINELGMIPEGLFAIEGVYQKAVEKNLIDSLPLLNAVYNILIRHVNPLMEFSILVKQLEKR
ncbi:MAG: NAD(P)-binding domain-containing protein [Chlorobi bacterium]|nr:NAD(P)-binding domain-containing protein [Chlorobiota bacterium]